MSRDFNIYRDVGCSQEDHLANCGHFGMTGEYLSEHAGDCPWKNHQPCNCNPLARGKKMPQRKTKRPSIGVAVLIVNDAKILLSPRLKPYGYKKLALPGGHVEWLETLIDTAVREVREETGIRINKKHMYNLHVFSEEVHPKLGKHYVTHYLIARLPKNQQPKNLEPRKHGTWLWYDPFNLPRNTWYTTKHLCSSDGSATLIREFIKEGRIK